MLQMKKIIIAIDGYAACGKSTTAKLVAARLKYAYIDTGAMYRAVTLYLMRNNIDPENEKTVQEALPNIHVSFKYNEERLASDTYLNGENVESEIEELPVSQRVSKVSAVGAVRRFLVAQQQEMGKHKGVVMDGRDIGTKVFPQAELKVFMDADFEMRAIRRRQELLRRNQPATLEEVKENLATRDRIDTTRKESPLVKADDAHTIDTTQLTIPIQVAQVIKMVEEIIG